MSLFCTVRITWTTEGAQANPRGVTRRAVMGASKGASSDGPEDTVGGAQQYETRVGRFCVAQVVRDDRTEDMRGHSATGRTRSTLPHSSTLPRSSTFPAGRARLTNHAADRRFAETKPVPKNCRADLVAMSISLDEICGARGAVVENRALIAVRSR
jgi:hypothetical protein